MLLRLKQILIIAFALLQFGCAVIDPQHLLTRNIGNDAPPAGVALDVETKKQAYEFVWNRIKDGYVDPSLRGLDWNKVGADYQPKLIQAKSDDAFWKYLDDMVAELGDAHTRVLSAKQYAYDKAKQSYTVGLLFAELDNELIVQGVLKHSPGDQAGIVRGNKVVSIDGVPALDWWHDKQLSSRKNSTERARVKSVKRVINGGDPEAPSDTLRLQIEDNEGRVADLSLTRAVVPRIDTLTTKMLADNIAYIRLTGFDQKLMRDIAPTFEKVQSASGMIIDLRGNGGGSLGLAIAMMNQLVEGKVSIGKRITRTGQAPSLFFGLISAGKLELELNGATQPYLGPLVILIDADSASASELMASSLQNLGRATVVGETSCGCLLGYLGYANIPGGGGLAYSEMDFAPVKGHRIEGIGVLPDIVLSAKRQDLVKEKDPVLEKAISSLNTMRQQSGIRAPAGDGANFQ